MRRCRATVIETWWETRHPFVCPLLEDETPFCPAALRLSCSAVPSMQAAFWEQTQLPEQSWGASRQSLFSTVPPAT